MSTALIIVMVVMMVVMTGGMVAGGVWAMLRQRQRDGDQSSTTRARSGR